MTIVEAPPHVTGGVDTHLDVHVAAALTRSERSLARNASGLTQRLQGAARLAAELR